MKTTESIAVVATGVLFPDAATPETFWENIVRRHHSVREIPAERWGMPIDRMLAQGYVADKAYSPRACLVDDEVLASVRTECTDLETPPELLAALDPLYTAVVHAGRQAIARCRLAEKTRERTGVVLAAIALPTDAASTLTRQILGASLEARLFDDRFSDATGRLSSKQSLASRVTSLPAALLAAALGLGGGSYTLDAACASSLFALKLACDELRAHRADAMLAGGVSRPDCLFTQVGFSQLRAMSPSGRCAPFDASADGLVVGEGAGVLVLKRLADALRQSDPILAVIRGIGISNDMRGNLLAPDSEGQLRAMQQAYTEAGWSPSDVDLIECHGAGTPVGDAIEIQSLCKLWEQSNWRPGQCAIGSVKSMIGHLLTAAGAAGMIKSLLALAHRTLPPSLNFTKPPPQSPMHGGPFRVQSKAGDWPRRDRQTPRRAAVSAFGFGGTNAHVLFEAFSPTDRKAAAAPLEVPAAAPGADVGTTPAAIVGMEAHLGSATNLRQLQEAIFSGKSIWTEHPPHRWRGSEAIATRRMGTPSPKGAYIGNLDIAPGEFHIPPKEIADLLPQHLLMLRTAVRAMADAGLGDRKPRPRMGVILGIEFDFEATNFHLRWHLSEAVARWQDAYGLRLAKPQREAWRRQLAAACHPPLTPTRTLGALGGVIASRVARELRCGGPCFGVSCEEASGLKALEIGLRALQQRQCELVLVGAVDLCGDVRNVVSRAVLRPYSASGAVAPFDRRADGTLPGEGSVALVLKRLQDAEAQGDRIYAVLKGLGGASGGDIASGHPRASTYALSLQRALEDAAVEADKISLLEAHGSGDPDEDAMEASVLEPLMARRADPCALASLKANVGHAGAAAGLASAVKTALCLYQQILPPMAHYSEPGRLAQEPATFHVPGFAQYWLRDRIDGPRRACTAAMTSDGNCAHAVLEEFTPADNYRPARDIRPERRQPLGLNPWGLFAVNGGSPRQLLEALTALERFRRKAARRPVSMEQTARQWLQSHGPASDRRLALAIIADSPERLARHIDTAREAVSAGRTLRIDGASGIAYRPEPQGLQGRIAFVFPGSGNHYLGMGREIGANWPEILRALDTGTERLKSQMLPACYTPHRSRWNPGWEQEANAAILSDPLHMIFGQVAHGCVVTRLVRTLGVEPDAAIGYSLGESAALFALEAWPDRGVMFERMRASTLFQSQLVGPCTAARKAWSIAPDEDFDWCAAVVNRPAPEVRRITARWPYVRLLIVNTPDECVLGGHRPQVEAVVKAVKGQALFLEGVAAVHCDAVRPVADAYRELHRFAVAPPAGIAFFSCAAGAPYDLNRENAADSILNQALDGFDFRRSIQRAYADGVRIFIEMGPQASCTRMIRRILQGRPHWAASACLCGENDYLSILKLVAELVAERVSVDLNRLYAPCAASAAAAEAQNPANAQKILLGAPAPEVRLPAPAPPRPAETLRRETVDGDLSLPPELAESTAEEHSAWFEAQQTQIIATGDAHREFLEFSEALSRNYAEAFELQTRLYRSLLDASGARTPAAGARATAPAPLFDRQQCLEFARGSAANVLGPEFAPVDTFRARVRLPDEPLMLVDRILSIDGEKLSMGPGRIVTEHDVQPGAWYLDGGHAPVCISVEAGQADLFLSAYLGIDHAVRGERTYRLLDATVTFHRGLPRPGNTLRYEIGIEKFVRQGETYLFFFHFEGFADDEPLITMTGGCAGFFTPQESRRSGGILLDEDQRRPCRGKAPADWQAPVALAETSYPAEALEALRAGDAASAFGDLFAGIQLPAAQRLPGGRMHLIDRILLLEPAGGCYGLGRIQAEADIHPDDWFLTCHFVDDQVMPGTLMYECCGHTLRVFLQRSGWITDNAQAHYEPVAGVAAVLRCRGPVTPETRTVRYEVEIKEIGYRPEPYALADAHMYADDRRIVHFRDMSLQLTGANRQDIEAFWHRHRQPAGHPVRQRTGTPPSVLFDRPRLETFATGKPSEAFGSPYAPYDDGRFIARLPAPPYLCLDRVVASQPEAWRLRPDGWAHTACDIDPGAWFFRAEQGAFLPFCILQEIGLQTCGWLAAYMGSALRSSKALYFRNLGGEATVWRTVPALRQSLSARARLTRVSDAADMLIEHFEFVIEHEAGRVYAGHTYFGFFTRQALAQQAGIRDAEERYQPEARHLARSRPHDLPDTAPLTPDDPAPAVSAGMTLPGRALRMIDRIEVYLPDGGPRGLGYVRGVKAVNPEEWFFKAHFFQDPVCPGSLGLESLLQLLKFAALQRWAHLAPSHCFSLLIGASHRWTYRGQITPAHHRITVEALVSGVEEGNRPAIRADGFLQADDLCIYEMENFGLRLVPATEVCGRTGAGPALARGG